MQVKTIRCVARHVEDFGKKPNKKLKAYIVLDISPTTVAFFSHGNKCKCLKASCSVHEASVEA